MEPNMGEPAGEAEEAGPLDLVPAASSMWRSACEALNSPDAAETWQQMVNYSGADTIWHSLWNCVNYQAGVWQKMLDEGIADVEHPAAFKLALLMRHAPPEPAMEVLSELLSSHPYPVQLNIIQYVVGLLRDDEPSGCGNCCCARAARARAPVQRPPILPERPVPVRDRQLYGDCELAVLAASREDYDLHTTLMRSELFELTPGCYTAVRIMALEQLSNTPKLYQTAEFEGLEAKARANIEDEIITLRNQKRGVRDQSEGCDIQVVPPTILQENSTCLSSTNADKVRDQSESCDIQAVPPTILQENSTCLSSTNADKVRDQSESCDIQAVPPTILQENSTCLSSTNADKVRDQSESLDIQAVPPTILQENSTCLSSTNAGKDKALVITKKIKSRCEQQQKKRLIKKVRRSKKIADFKILMKDLKVKKFVNDDHVFVLEQYAGSNDFLKRQIAQSVGLPLERQHSEEIRKFALTLHFLSPKAYHFVRRTYNTCLPHPSTLSKWYQNVNAEPGFCTEAFNALKLKVETGDMPVICAMVLDEMTIGKGLCWDPQTKTYYGRVNVGTDCDFDSLDVANECLVLLLTCANGSWKLPVGYFFITALSGEQKAVLVKICIRKCEQVGVKVVSLTCDGQAANFSMFAALGCDISEGKTTFTYSNSIVHAIIDPCHALKLVRNAFEELRVFYDIHGRKIDYMFVEHLLNSHEAKVHFKQHEVTIKLSTQHFDTMVADFIEYCSDLKIDKFQGSEGTVYFIRLLNCVFDVLNSRSLRATAICSGNFSNVAAFFDEAIQYLVSLTLPSGQKLIGSRRKTGFLSLILDMHSASQLYGYLVIDTKMLQYLPMYNFSQDHLELLFSAIRARGGFNDKPNAVQFRAAFKRLLIRPEIRHVGVGKCVPLEQINVLTCSSKTNPISAINQLTDRNILVELPADDSDAYEEFIDCMYNNVPNKSEFVVTYIADVISRKLARSVKCVTCVYLLFGDPNEDIENKDMPNILIKIEKVLKGIFQKELLSEQYYLHAFRFFMERFDTSNLFISTLEHDTTHRLLLIKSIFQTYMDLRFKYGKKTTEKISFFNYFSKVLLYKL